MNTLNRAAGALRAALRRWLAAAGRRAVETLPQHDERLRRDIGLEPSHAGFATISQNVATSATNAGTPSAAQTRR